MQHVCVLFIIVLINLEFKAFQYYIAKKKKKKEKKKVCNERGKKTNKKNNIKWLQNEKQLWILHLKAEENMERGCESKHNY